MDRYLSLLLCVSMEQERTLLFDNEKELTACWFLKIYLQRAREFRHCIVCFVEKTSLLIPLSHSSFQTTFTLKTIEIRKPDCLCKGANCDLQTWSQSGSIAVKSVCVAPVYGCWTTNVHPKSCLNLLKTYLFSWWTWKHCLPATLDMCSLARMQRMPVPWILTIPF